MRPALGPGIIAFVLALEAAGACATPRVEGAPARVLAVGAEAVPRGLARYMRAEPEPRAEEKAALGQRLFFDTILAADGKVRCASCHQPDRAFTDGRSRSRGVFGRVGLRSVPSILNAGYGSRFFWDGRDSVLARQVLQPVVNPNELGMDTVTVVERLNEASKYRQAFVALFPDGVTWPNLGRVLASYVRTLRAGESPFDRFAEGDTRAVSAAARRGYALFTGRARCGACHAGPLFTDEEFHNTGVGWGSADFGRALVTHDMSDRGKFNTPSLRNVALTAPYMHDGSIATLEDVVLFYDRGANPNPGLDPLVAPRGLSAGERSDLVAFLQALTSSSSP